MRGFQFGYRSGQDEFSAIEDAHPIAASEFRDVAGAKLDSVRVTLDQRG